MLQAYRPQQLITWPCRPAREAPPPSSAPPSVTASSKFMLLYRYSCACRRWKWVVLRARYRVTKTRIPSWWLGMAPVSWVTSDAVTSTCTWWLVSHEWTRSTHKKQSFSACGGMHYSLSRRRGGGSEHQGQLWCHHVTENTWRSRRRRGAKRIAIQTDANRWS